MLYNHLQEVEKTYSVENIIGIFSVGSHNYGLNTSGSDMDTKCIIVPSLKDISLNHKPDSKTLHLPNNEQCDIKDIRAYMDCFTKQNINFMEILFSEYKVVNSTYEDQWDRLVEAREEIARMNPSRALQTMLGVARNKKRLYMYMRNDHIEDKLLGYNPKDLYQFLRIYYFTEAYLKGLPYKECLRPIGEAKDHILAAKNGNFSSVVAFHTVEKLYEDMYDKVINYCALHDYKEDKKCRELLEDVCYEIMKISLLEEIQ